MSLTANDTARGVRKKKLHRRYFHFFQQCEKLAPKLLNVADPAKNKPVVFLIGLLVQRLILVVLLSAILKIMSRNVSMNIFHTLCLHARHFDCGLGSRLAAGHADTP